MRDDTKGKAQIDQVRSSALSMQIGNEEDGAVLDMIEIGGRLHIIKNKSIYCVALADETDPERKVISIPNTQQKILGYGADSFIVQRVLLTAKELFKVDRLIGSLDAKEALRASVELTQNICSANEIAEQIDDIFRDNEKKTLKSNSGSLTLPSTPNLIPQCKTFIQKAEHALQCMSKICVVFCGQSILKKWPDGLVKYMKENDGDSETIAFIEQFADFGKKLRNIRHCIEHEKKSQRLEIFDYGLGSTGKLSAPTIAVVHEETPISTVPVDQFMNHLVSTLVTFSESLIATMANQNVTDFGVFRVVVGELPENMRRLGVRYGYLIKIDGRYQKFG
ncbi:hypothetical protein ACTOV4_01030 [Brucella sp. C7-11G]